MNQTAKKSVADLLDIAIKNEINAYNFYKKSVNETKIQSVKILFEKLSHEEKKHKEMLQKLKKDKKNIIKNSVNKLSIDIAKHLMMTPTSELHELKKIFSYAKKKETQASTMYINLAKKVEDKSSKALLISLAKQEHHHKVLIETNEKICF